VHDTGLIAINNLNLPALLALVLARILARPNEYRSTHLLKDLLKVCPL